MSLSWLLAVQHIAFHFYPKRGVVEGDAYMPAAGLDALLLVYVSLLGSAASYGVFFYNASRGNLTALSSLTFLTPMFAAASG